MTIYHGDCLDHPELWLSAGVCITDPPYGLQSLAGSYGRHGDTIANDEDTTTRDGMLEMWDAKPVLVFSSPRLSEPPGEWDFRLVWDKAEPGLNGGPWRYNHEPIFVRGEGWTRSDHHFSILRFSIKNGAADRGDHPHRKPVPLMRALLGAAPAGVIADPFMGSGTTLRAAKDLGRLAVGVEVNEQFCEIAANRCSQEVLDLRIAA